MLQLQFFYTSLSAESVDRRPVQLYEHSLLVLETLAKVLHSACISDMRRSTHSLHCSHIAYRSWFASLLFSVLLPFRCCTGRLCCQLCSNFIINFLLLHFYISLGLSCSRMPHRTTPPCPFQVCSVCQTESSCCWLR